MELSPSWEPASYVAIQELPSNLWNLKFHCHVHKSTPLVSKPDRSSPYHPIVLSKTNFNIIHKPMSWSSSAKRLPHSCESFYTTKTSHYKQEIFLCEYPWVVLPALQKTHNRTLLFGRILLKHGRHFDYANQPLTMRMCICYLHCHEAGRWWYLVIHIKNLLRTLQLLYFHLWPIYWLIFILSTHLRLGLPSGLFPSSFPTNPICIPFLSHWGIQTLY
jgi:hypothetical protein